MTRMAIVELDQPGAQAACLANAPAELADGWAEWLPEHVVHTTLRAPSGAQLRTGE